jgi:hypothetical protein
MKHIDENCEHCSEPIYENEGRIRIRGKAYHVKPINCYLESIGENGIEKSAESMTFDKRIVA